MRQFAVYDTYNHHFLGGVVASTASEAMKKAKEEFVQKSPLIRPLAKDEPRINARDIR